MPVFDIPFTISGRIKIEAEDVADAKAKLEEADLSQEQYAEQGELEVFEPVLEQTE